MNVLVADDALYIREKTRQFFKAFKEIQLFEAENGKEAIECIKNQKIDLLIVDSVMPEMSGIQVIVEAKKISPNILAFGLTTQDKGATRNRFLEVGAQSILKKPFTEEGLHYLLKEYI